jgi:hypothetical protein
VAGVGQRLRLRLFLEGVEVPVIAATVQVVPNAPAACSIQIPPIPEGTQLFPRTLVHCFFLDPNAVSSPFASPSPQGTAITNTNQSPSNYEFYQFNNTNSPGSATLNAATASQQDLTNSNYKLLFGGEVVGFQWTKNQGQRSLVLQCLDWSNYWDYAYQWNNTDLFGPGIKALFAGGSTNLFTDFLGSESEEILKIIQTPSIQYPNLPGLLGGIVHLLEAIGGSYYYPKMIAGENIFYTIAELRLHITQMITAFANDPTASNLLKAGYDSLFGRMLGGLGQQVSIRQAINALMSAIFHETYAIPSPFYVPGSGNTPSGQSTSSVRADPDNAFIATTADNLLLGIQAVQAQLAASAVGGAGSASTAAAGSSATLLQSLSQMRSTCNATANMITAATVLGAKSSYASASAAFGQAMSAAQQWVPGANVSISNKIDAALTTAQTALQAAAQFVETKPTLSSAAARLNSQIFRPDVWFSAPPCCNVIFPEQYDTLTYTRKFLEEPTRLLLKTNNEFHGEDELFDSFYFAPKGLTLKTGSKELAALLHNDLLDHEMFSGILPVFEKMGELNIFAASSGTVQGPLAKVGPAQRSTNFLYFKYRFAARQLSLSGKFNPWLAPGFPAFIIDKYVNNDALALRQQLIQQNNGVVTNDVNNATLGAHFLCNLTEVEHSLSQSRGSTTLNCSYARQPWEGVEFLGNARATQPTMAPTGSGGRITLVAAIGRPQPNALGPNGGIITAVEDVTQAHTGTYDAGSNTLQGQALPWYQAASSGQAGPNVVPGVSAPATAYPQAILAPLGITAAQAQDTLVLFHAYLVTETVTQYTASSQDLPFESYIRPGWYGPVWTTGSISQAYQQFFGVSAITDQTTVNGGSTSATNPNSGALQAQQQASAATSADDPAAQAPGILQLQTDSSVEAACAFLVQLYSTVRSSNADVEAFISAYTGRAIATMVDLFGTSNLALSTDGTSIVSGIEGFHSRAFGPYDNLFGLVSPQISSITGIQRGSTAAQRADTRGRKQQAVTQYVQQLQFARAILG